MFVRPRFFPGQLLCEDDLQGLSDYVVAKDRLHNRYLAGDGVSCGLLVRCDGEGRGTVTVGAGYAIDCCGNDVVVPCDIDLDINALIAKMPRTASCDDPCPDPEKGETRDPAKMTRTYTLVVVYDEEQTDPVVPYPVGDDTGSACAGGTWAPACEASRVQEGHRFELRCGRPTTDVVTIDERLIECLAPLSAKLRRVTPEEPLALRELIASVIERISNTSERAQELCDDRFVFTVEDRAQTLQDVSDLREDLVAHLERAPFTCCDLLCDLQHLDLSPDCSTLKSNAYRLRDLGYRVVRECVCSVVNPPCPTCNDPAVVLATISVRQCAVIEVCNAVRRHVLSPRTARYWLFPIEMAYQWLERICCCGEIPREASGILGRLERLRIADDEYLTDKNMRAAAQGLVNRDELNGELSALEMQIAGLREMFATLSGTPAEPAQARAPAAKRARKAPGKRPR
jgi:hypothetical protein